MGKTDHTAGGLVTAGDYHNSIMTIAVKCGLPAAVLLSLALAVLLWRSDWWSDPQDDNPKLAILYAAMMGALLPITGQMLMNGGGQDLQAVCVMLGFFHGIRRQRESTRVTESALTPAGV